MLNNWAQPQDDQGVNDLLFTVLYATEQFFKSADFTTSLRSFLPKLGRDANIDCVYIFPIINEYLIGVAPGQRLEWSRSSDGTRAQGFSLSFGDKLLQQLNRGPFTCNINQVDKSQINLIEFLHSYSIVSTLVIPLFVNNKMFGVMGFEYNTGEHHWYEHDIEPLVGCANILSAAIKNELNSLELRKREEQYRGIVEDQTELICRWNRNGVITFINNAFLRFFHIQSGLDIIGSNFYEFFENKLNDGNVTWREKLTSLTPYSSTATYTFKLKNKMWLHFTVRGIYSNDLIAEYQCVARDITDLITAEDTVKISENKLQFLFNSMLDGFLLVSIVGREIVCSEANRSFVTMMHLGDDVTNKHLHDILPDMAQQWGNDILNVHKTRVSKEVEGELFDGYYEIKIYPSNNGDQVAVLISDRTEKRNSSLEIEKTNKRLSDLLQKLEVSNRQITLINSMSEMLLSCNSIEEAYQVVSNFAPEIFPGSTGSMYIESEGSLTMVSEWGGKHDFSVSHDNCWALRRGQLYSTTASKGLSLVCGHSKHFLDGGDYLTVCVPMNAQGIVSGLFSVIYVSPDIKQYELSELTKTVSEQIVMGLANIMLKESLKNLSVRDPLTKLFNRRYMEESLIREISQAKRRGTPVSVIMADIDHFKTFNDNYGHEAGDNVLKSFAELMSGSVRVADIPCRYGGEEFIIILPGAGTEIALQRADEIRSKLAVMELEFCGNKINNLTASFGVAVYPDHADNIDKLIGLADQSLYISKQNGRNMVTVYSELKCLENRA